jgi:tRNA-(ms[2]io[6]A)-hydroxylase
LAEPTPTEWAERAAAALDEVLLDHAHCEKKAASTAINLIFRYPDYPSLAVPLARIAREELAHFEQVIEHLRSRGLEYQRQVPSRYAGRLMKVVRNSEPAGVIDTLLCCALIEARSCERMQRLAEWFERTETEPALARLYRGLLASEARHHATYVDLARALGVCSEEDLRSRWVEVARHEASVQNAEKDEPVRMHN